MILQYILLATLLAGIFQVLFGVFKIAKYIRLVPIYVLFGLVNGLAIITFVSQFYTFKSESYTYSILVLATVLIVYFLPKFNKMIPSTLVALIVISFIVINFDLDTKKISDITTVSSSFPTFSIPKIYINFEAILMVLPYSLLIAFVSSLESLLTLSLLDEMSEKKGNANQECIALGAGNIACSFFGAPAGSSMLGQSILNYKNNAFGRLSTLIVPIFIMLFILYFAEFIERIPLAVLVGILASIPIFLFQWQNSHQIKKLTSIEKVIIVLVTAITIVAHLEIAFLLALLISFILYVIQLMNVKSKTYTQDDVKVYELYGPLHCCCVDSFLEIFDVQHDPKAVTIHFKHVRVIDKKALQAIEKVVDMYKQKNTLLRIKYLSTDCKNNLKEALYYCEYNEDDPTYKVAVDT
jgi:sulfate permease, SulP family